MPKTEPVWQNMGLYWALRSDASKTPHAKPPTVKRLQYVTISHADVSMRLAVTVFDDEVPTEVHRNELAWHVKHGAKVTHDPA